jgi:glutathione synthase
MRFVYIMDPMERLVYDKDTTFAFIAAAQSRGHEALHTRFSDLYVRDGDVFANTRSVTVSKSAPFFTYGEARDIHLADAQAVLIRKDPPFDSAYLYGTLILERLRDRTVIMNDPRGLRDANEKLYALHFARHMPKTFVGTRQEKIFEFVDSVGTAVIKPLYGAGGMGVLLLSRADKNARSIVDILTEEGTKSVMVQEFIPDVTKGDRRVLVLDGEVLGAINRVPRADDIRSNIHVGGTVVPHELDEHEKRIVADIAPRLKKDGLFFVGLDIIGGKLTEVNVTSPTGIQELSAHMARDMAVHVIEWLEKHAEEYQPQMRSIPPL